MAYGGTRGEHEHRDLIARGAEAPADLDAVQTG
jgi:hypothetical protein